MTDSTTTVSTSTETVPHADTGDLTGLEYKVALENFSGPLDLLLYLIRKNEIDVYDIPITTILDQYMGYVDALKSVDLDSAGDFLVMASTLMVIKSKMLLPIEEVDLDEELDPRYELVQQLLDYKRIREQVTDLETRAAVVHRRVGRPNSARPGTIVVEDRSLDDVQVWDLFHLFGKVLEQTGGNVNRERLVEVDDVPVRVFAQRLEERVKSAPVSLYGLFEEQPERSTLVGYFLATLLLMKTQIVTARQDEMFGDIHLVFNAEKGAEDRSEQELELEDDFN